MVSRRKFLITAAAAGGALLVGYAATRSRELLGDPSLLATQEGETALNAWLKIDAEGTVSVAVHRAEMGQGIYTGLAMLVAEELDVAWENIRYEIPLPDKFYANIIGFADAAPFDNEDHGFLAESARWGFKQFGALLGGNFTGGSSGIRDAWEPLRAGGAAARDMLLRAGAERLGVPVSECTTDSGEVVHRASHRKVSYGALAGEAARLSPPQDIPYKLESEYKVIGQPMPRLDIPAKVNGSATFGIDVRPEGLVFAAVVASPKIGGQLKSFDAGFAQDMPGVIKIIATDDSVIAIAKTYWEAKKAVGQVITEFEDPEPFDNDSIAAIYAQGMEEDGFAFENVGDARDNLAQSSAVIRADYTAPMLAHACMEPQNCTALITDARCDVWAGNQAPLIFRDLAAGATGLDKEKVFIHTQLMGGAFGGRGEPAVLYQAIAAAQAVKGTPVQLIWSREEDIQKDAFRPIAHSRFEVTLDEAGQIENWYNKIAAPSPTQSVMSRWLPNIPFGGPDRTCVDGAIFLDYKMANRCVEQTAVEMPFPIGFWRSVGHSFHAFFTESFMDELAHSQKQDPLQFRRQHLADGSRSAAVLDLLAEKSQWGDILPPGHATGVALHESFHSIVGQVAEVEVVDSQIKVHRVVCVIDCGRAINPDSVIAQMESGIVYGLTAALYGRIDMKDGRVMQDNFPNYRMAQMRDTPKIETYVINSGAPIGGVGEPGTPPIAPAVSNAVYVLTGKRNRSLPLEV
ncbi:MAG: molybdopterin cofactor-binding domain-containing protein [Pseudomonadota bacterium]